MGGLGSDVMVVRANDKTPSDFTVPGANGKPRNLRSQWEASEVTSKLQEPMGGLGVVVIASGANGKASEVTSKLQEPMGGLGVDVIASRANWRAQK
ncbi:hypothetical protein O3P69_019302 [Scylla paramamosain]|uniref:Uncharacterized protein n=1 Tax=Scylla paramamosain TaxID=85552 RepID=A0AAW0SW54_SCYPA